MFCFIEVSESWYEATILMKTLQAHAGTAESFLNTEKGSKMPAASVNRTSHVIQEYGMRFGNTEVNLSNWRLAPGAGKPPKEEFIFVSPWKAIFISLIQMSFLSPVSLLFFFFPARKLCKIYLMRMLLKLCKVIDWKLLTTSILLHHPHLSYKQHWH